MIKLLLFITLTTLALHAQAEEPASPEIRADTFFKMTTGKDSSDTILMSSSKLEGEQAYFMSYTIEGRLVRIGAMPKEHQEDLIARFEQSFPPQRQKRLESITRCVAPLKLKFKKTADGEVVSRDMCLDTATRLEKEAFAKIWLDIRGLMRI